MTRGVHSHVRPCGDPRGVLAIQDSPKSETLDTWARTHVRYEAQMLVAGAVEFVRRYSSMPPQDSFREPTIDDALLEATLVHLRLVDEFLAGSPHPHAVNAAHWLPQWSSRGISTEVRERIDAQVAHLSSSRVPHHDWEIQRNTYECCVALDRFLQAVAVRRPERSAAFEGAREQVHRGLGSLAP